MKPLSYILFTFNFSLFTQCVIAQQPQYPDSGFTNKAEAKNLTINDLKEGTWFEYLDSLRIATTDSNAPYYAFNVYKYGKFDKVQHGYYKSGKLLFIAPYINGKETGRETFFYENGKIKSEGLLSSDTLIGIVKSYYPAGNVKTFINYDHGKKDGLVKIYYENGNLHQEAQYVQGILNGFVHTYYEDGKLRDVDTYSAGKFNGLSKFYYEDGKVKRTVSYDDGVMGEIKNYDESGNEIK